MAAALTAANRSDRRCSAISDPHEELSLMLSPDVGGFVAALLAALGELGAALALATPAEEAAEDAPPL